jgi:alcohol dehydrogenase
MESTFKMSDIFMFQLPRKIIFGNGTIHQIGGEIKALNVRKPIIVTDPGVVQAGLLTDAISSLNKEGIPFEIFDHVEPDPPLRIVEECTRKVKKEHFDGVIGIGGGSTIDAAKAISFMATHEGDIRQYLGTNKVQNPGITKIFVPTTAGTGSEISNTFVLTDEQSKAKIASYSPFTFADVSLVDPVLTLSLPPKITAESGIDALSHALESYVTVKANPFSEMLSLKGIKYIGRYLRPAYTKGSKLLEARYFMCLGVCMGTMAIRSSGLGAIHALCYPPALKHHLSHGMAIGLMMLHVMEYNLISNLEKYAHIAEALGMKIEGLSTYEAALKSLEAVRTLLRDLGFPPRLREVGISEEDFDQYAENVPKFYAHHLANNPRDLSVADIKQIYRNAY